MHDKPLGTSMVDKAMQPAQWAFAFWWISIGVLLSGCILTDTSRVAVAGAQTRQALTVFTAASLTEAFTEIGVRFESEHPGVRVRFNFAGSQQLAHQLAQGAPADVFASADQKQMGAAIQAGRISQGGTQIFAGNRLVVIHPKDNPAELKRLQDLTKPGLKLVLADQAVPVGRYTLEFLENASQDSALGANFKDKVMQNVVSYEENVRAVLSKVVLGEADAGVVYTSDISEANADQVGELVIPQELNVAASYYIAPTIDTSQRPLAEAFIAFVLSTDGQETLTGYGFVPIH